MVACILLGEVHDDRDHDHDHDDAGPDMGKDPTATYPKASLSTILFPNLPCHQPQGDMPCISGRPAHRYSSSSHAEPCMRLSHIISSHQSSSSPALPSPTQALTDSLPLNPDHKLRQPPNLPKKHCHTKQTPADHNQHKRNRECSEEPLDVVADIFRRFGFATILMLGVGVGGGIGSPSRFE